MYFNINTTIESMLCDWRLYVCSIGKRERERKLPERKTNGGMNVVVNTHT